MHNISAKIKSIIKNVSVREMLWHIKITFFRLRKKVRQRFKKTKLRYPKIFNPQENRAFLVVSFIMLLCVVLSASYAIFVFSTNSYKVADIKMANLTYSMKIDNVNTFSKQVQANSTTSIQLELTAINPITSKYLVYYTSNDSLTGVNVQYSSVTTGFGSGKIGAEAFRIITIVVTNESSSAKTIDFNVKGGYVYNSLSLDANQYEISGTYDDRDTEMGDITINTYLNGRKVSTVPTYAEMQADGYMYDTIASGCNNGATLSTTIDQNTNSISVSNVTGTTQCNVIFHNKDDLTTSFISDGQYLSEAPPKSNYNYVSSTCDNSADISWNETKWEATVSNVAETPTNCVVKFEKLQFSKESFASTLVANNSPTTYTTIPGREAATTDEGLIEGPNDNYRANTYYFRGGVVDNYVSFAGKMWRIIRVNGDGSVRIILDTVIDSYSTWNSEARSTDWTVALSYAAYGSSTIKRNLDTWYTTNIGNNSNYLSKVIETKFCNDRSYKTGSDYYRFGAYNRVTPNGSITNATPSFVCSTSASGENNIYNLNIGLITADEVAFAGGAYDLTNQSYYLYNPSITGYWWTMSPSGWSFYSDSAITVFSVTASSGELNDSYAGGSDLMRPVLSLKADTIVTTASATNPGTVSNPYIVQ